MVTVVKTKKAPHTHKKKGELMENDQDAMEVSYDHLSFGKIFFRRRNVYILLYQNVDLVKFVNDKNAIASSGLPVEYPICICGVLQYSSEEEEVDLQTALTGFQTKQRKVLEPVDHGKIQYEPYRKNFYVEVPELAKMSQDGE